MAHEIIDGMEQGYKAFVFEPTRTRFLVIPRDAWFDRRWDIPGGRQNEGELPVDALRRELREEMPWLRSTVDLPEFDLDRAVCGRQIITKSTGGFVLRRLVVAETPDPMIPPEFTGQVDWATPDECVKRGTHGTDEYLVDFLSNCIRDRRNLAELLPTY